MLPHLNTLFEEFQFHCCYLLFWYLTINSYNLNASNIQELSLHWTWVPLFLEGATMTYFFPFLGLTTTYKAFSQ